MAARASSAKSTTKGKTSKTREPVKLNIVKKDKVVEAVQYVNGSYAVATTPPGLSMPKVKYYGTESNEGSSQADNLRGAHIYRVAENTAMIQFGCGDYLFVNIDKMIETMQAVKGLDITKAPRSRKGN